ncbi:unknown [Coraliomargarita sp. CAG:312]|nr:unknown [Coraliomargarita sp. CAG:312]
MDTNPSPLPSTIEKSFMDAAAFPCVVIKYENLSASDPVLKTSFLGAYFPNVKDAFKCPRSVAGS